MRVPLLDVARQNLPLEGEFVEAFRNAVHSGQFILGAEVERFEAAAAALAGARHGIGMSSGTDAILCALMALGIGPGDEVICPAFTFFATAGCIARVGARPVFADSLPGCFNMDPAQIEALITPRTRAIMPVHLFGQAADMAEILEIARRRGVAVIEDAAQSYGAHYGGQPVCSFGDFAAVSFFPTKNLGALGDAGILFCQDDALGAKARLLRNHGAERRYYHSAVGGNFRLDALQASMLSIKLRHLGSYTANRQANAQAYTKAFAALPQDGPVRVMPPAIRPGRDHIANQYTLRVLAGPGWNKPENPRDALRAFLNGRQIAAEIYYPVPLHRQECFRACGPHPALPVAEALAREVLSLPVFPEMTGEERAAVVEGVSEFVRSAVAA